MIGELNLLQRHSKVNNFELVWVCDFFFNYILLLYYIQNCEYRNNLFFEITFEWFKIPETKL
jgi:hypothetical protein